MQKLVLVVLSVFSVSASLAHGQKGVTVSLPLGVYTSPNEQATCSALGVSFEAKWRNPPSACGDAAAAESAWNMYKAGSSAPGFWFPKLQDSRSLADCKAKARVLPDVDSNRADGDALCEFIGRVVAACSCEKMECVTGSVNKEVVARADVQACGTFAQGVCLHYRDTIASQCAASMLSPPRRSSYNPRAVPVACRADQCPKTTGEVVPPATERGVTVTLPLGVYTSPEEQASCGALGDSFEGKWTTPPSACGGPAAVTAAWNTFKAGASATGQWFPQLQDSRDLADCKAKALVLDPANRADGVSLCEFISGVVLACSCDKLRCVTSSVNSEVTGATACKTFAQGVCLHFQDAIVTECAEAVIKPPNRSAYNPMAVPVGCRADQCPAASLATPSSSTATPSSWTPSSSKPSSSKLSSSTLLLLLVISVIYG